MALEPLLTSSTQNHSKPLIMPHSGAAFFLVTGLFFLWGVPNNLNDILIRQFMKSFEITRFQAGLVQSAFYMGYFLFSIPAATVMRRFGYKTGLITGLLLYSFGTFLFLPAAQARSYVLFLMALFDPESAVRRLNFSQAFNPLGAISGVLIGTLFIFSGVELKAPDIARMKLAGAYDAYLQHETMRVIAPYMVLGVVVLVWTIFILLTKFPAIATTRSTDTNGYPHFLLAVVTQFCYVGAQVGTWSYFIQYVQDYTHLPEKTAGYLLTTTLAGFGIGRFASSQWMKVISPSTLMGLFAVINIVLVMCGVVWPGWFGMIAVLLTSFFMSLMFPTIFALGIRDLGPNTKPAASLIVMAIIGGAVFTPVMGLVFQATKSMATAMLVPLGCYLIVAAYAFWGCKLVPLGNSSSQMLNESELHH